MTDVLLAKMGFFLDITRAFEFGNMALNIIGNPITATNDCDWIWLILYFKLMNPSFYQSNTLLSLNKCIVVSVISVMALAQ